METAHSENIVDIHLNKIGPAGRPVALVMAAPSVSLDKLTSAIQKAVTRNTDLRSKLGLKACTSCASSGFDLDIRHRFDHVLTVDLGNIVHQ
jgi:hypothetical protein